MVPLGHALTGQQEQMSTSSMPSPASPSRTNSNRSLRSLFALLKRGNSDEGSRQAGGSTLLSNPSNPAPPSDHSEVDSFRETPQDHLPESIKRKIEESESSDRSKRLRLDDRDSSLLQIQTGDLSQRAELLEERSENLTGHDDDARSHSQEGVAIDLAEIVKQIEEGLEKWLETIK